MRLKIILAFCALAIGAGLFFLPWKDMAADGLAAMAKAKGFPGTHVTFTTLGLDGATVQDITIGGATPVTVRKATLSYALLDLLRQKPGAGLTLSATDIFVADNNVAQVDIGVQRQEEWEARVIFATMPWKGGTLAVRDVKIPLMDKNQDIDLVLQVSNVSLGDLMQALTGERVSATGTVSGTIPLTLGQDGSVKAGAGLLRANTPGIITMPPDAIPGDNEQVALTREILKNLHYQGLSIGIKTGADNKIALNVAVEGSNPDVYGGRQVKLNVNLQGDVLDYIRQNVLLLTKPESMLKQDQK